MCKMYVTYSFIFYIYDICKIYVICKASICIKIRSLEMRYNCKSTADVYANAKCFSGKMRESGKNVLRRLNSKDPLFISYILNNEHILMSKSVCHIHTRSFNSSIYSIWFRLSVKILRILIYEGPFIPSTRVHPRSPDSVLSSFF